AAYPARAASRSRERGAIGRDQDLKGPLRPGPEPGQPGGSILRPDLLFHPGPDRRGPGHDPLQSLSALLPRSIVPFDLLEARSHVLLSVDELGEERPEAFVDAADHRPEVRDHLVEGPDHETVAVSDEGFVEAQVSPKGLP